MITDNYTIRIFADEKGREPFIEWLESIKDKRSQLRIRNRIRRIELGNFGEYRFVGTGVFELKCSFGPGYRVYFAKVENTVVVLLAGGDKSSQNRDIERAKTYWKQYKEQR